GRPYYPARAVREPYRTDARQRVDDPRPQQVVAKQLHRLRDQPEIEARHAPPAGAEEDELLAVHRQPIIEVASVNRPPRLVDIWPRRDAAQVPQAQHHRRHDDYTQRDPFIAADRRLVSRLGGVVRDKARALRPW